MFKKIPGPVLMIITSCLFATGGLLIKLIPWSAFAVNGARSFIAVWIILAYMKFSGYEFKINKTVLIGALCISSTTFLYAAANKLTTAGNAIILEFTSPIFVMIYNRLLYGRKTLRRDKIVCLFVFIGVIVFVVDGLSAGNMLGNALALISGATFAGVYLINEGGDASPLSSVALSDIICFLVSIPWLLKVDYASVTQSTWTALIILGVFQLGVAYVFFTEGIKKTPPVTASLLSVVETVLNPVLVAIAMKEMLTPLAFAGAVVILVSVTVYNVLLAKDSAKQV